MLVILAWNENRGKTSSQGGEGRREEEVGEEEGKEEGLDVVGGGSPRH